MEYFDFEGRSEAEAIELAAAELELDPEQFEVELLTTAGRGIFRRGKVKIRVYPLVEPKATPAGSDSLDLADQQSIITLLEQFFGEISRILGVDFKPRLQQSRDHQMEVELVSEDSGYLIGHHGKHLEALQILVTAYLSNRLARGENREKNFVRVVLDAEGYRGRREKQLRRLAKSIAQKVVKSQGSELLEPMVACERRIIHAALSETPHVSTASEGEGERRQVRILYRG